MYAEPGKGAIHGAKDLRHGDVYLRLGLSWRSHHPSFKLGRTDLAEGRVSSSLVVEYLDEVEESHLGLAATEEMLGASAIKCCYAVFEC